MSVMELILGRFADRKKQVELSAWERYRKLIDDVLDGVDHEDVDEVESILQGAGKTQEDLVNDVETVKQRRQWVADLARESEIPKLQVDEKHEAVKRARFELHQATVKLQEAEAAARDASVAQNAIGFAIQKARNSLRETVLDPEISKQLEAVNAELQELGDKERSIRQGRSEVDNSQKADAMLRGFIKWKEKHEQNPGDPYLLAEFRRHEADYQNWMRDRAADRLELEAIKARREEVMEQIALIYRNMEEA